MMRSFVFLAATLLCGAAQANCQWIDRPTADRALSILRDTSSMILGDRVGPEPVPRIEIIAAPSYTQSWDGGPWHGLVAHGGRAIDIEQVYVQSTNGAYVSLGLLVGCAGDGAPPELPDLPSIEAADRSDAPIPAISDSRFIGLIDLPNFSWDIPEADRKPVTLYSAPSLSAPVHATIRGWDELPSDEMGYEETAALVLEENEGWYRIGTMNGRLPADAEPDGRWALHWFDFASAGPGAWVAPNDAGELKPFETLVTDNLTYLGDRWDGLISAEPDAAAAVWALAPQWQSSFSDSDRIAVVVHETRRVGNRLWARIAIQWPGECERFRPIPIAEGWVPAHTAAGQPVVQYYSRGC